MCFVLLKDLVEREKFLTGREPNQIELKVEGKNVGLADGLAHDECLFFNR